MKTFFPRKKTLFFIIFSKFFNVQSFLLFLPNKSHEGWKNIFKKYYHMIRILQQIYYFSDFKKNQFFSKNPSIFSKKPKFWAFWESLLLQSHSTANLPQFDEKKLTFKHVNNRCWLVYANSIGKYWVKKRTHLRGRFCFPYFQYGAK